MTQKFAGGVEINAPITPAFREILTDEAVAFVAKLQRTFGLTLPHWQVGQIFAYAVLIGPHKAACTKLDAAKPAAHHHAQFANAAVQHNLQHGPASSAVGFSII